MDALLRRLSEANVGALMVLVLLFAALLAGGANDAMRAALLSALVAASLIIVVIVSPRSSLISALGANWLSALALLGFVALAVASLRDNLWPQLTHPLWTLSRSDGGPMTLSPFRTVEGLAAFLGAPAAYLLGALLGRTRNARDWIGRWLMFLSLLYAIIGLYRFFVLGEAHSTRLDFGLSSANAAAALCGVLLLAGATMAVRAVRGRLDADENLASLPRGLAWATFLLRAPFSSAAALVLFACLLLTASRGGLTATAIGALVFATAIWAHALKSSGARRGALMLPLAVLAGLFALFFLRGGDAVLARFALAQEDFEIRRTLADAHWGMFLERPLFGHGLNTYHELNSLAATPENWLALRAPGSAHNIFIQVMEETGLVGLGLWLAMLGQPLWRAISRIAGKRSGGEWAAAALAASTLLLLHGLVDFALQVPAIAALFAFLLGAWVGQSSRAQGGGAPMPGR